MKSQILVFIDFLSQKNISFLEVSN